MRFDPFGFYNLGTIASGSGELITSSGGSLVTTPVASPIALGDGNHRLIDNETNAVITGGNGNNIITEFAAGAKITLGNGNDLIADSAGSATVVAGNGDQLVNAAGANNTVTVGNGFDVIDLGQDGNHLGRAGFGHWTAVATATPPVTSDTVNLGGGTNLLFLGGSGNTIHDGGGTDTIFGAGAGKDTFVINAAGGSITVGGFSLTNGDALDLTRILAGVSLAPDLSNLGSFVGLTTRADAYHAGSTDTVLSIHGTGGTASVTLLNTGSITLGGLENSLVLPPH